MPTCLRCYALSLHKCAVDNFTGFSFFSFFDLASATRCQAPFDAPTLPPRGSSFLSAHLLLPGGPRATQALHRRRLLHGVLHAR
jgi:hypothetical protein